MASSTSTSSPSAEPEAAAIARLRDVAVDYAVLSGLHAPFALFPSLVPRDCFARATALQPLFNALVAAAAADAAFVADVIGGVAAADAFVRRCFAVYAAARAEGETQRITLGVHRSDYLLHSGGDAIEIQQVELNTIAASFACLSAKTAELHRFLHLRPENASKYSSDSLPLNNSLDGLVRGLARAWELYNNKDSVIVMVVQPGERNSFDQRWIENTLFTKYGITLLRRSLSELLDQGSLVGEDRKLVLTGGIEVAVAYYRAGYTPADYPSEKEWDARLLVERSYAIKCPNMAYHLIGSKKVQQILAQPNMLERFVSPAHASALRSCFTGLYPLDESPEGLAALQMGLQEPERFVMKPQREGGGNNIYGLDVRTTLQKLSAKERNAFILMELIKPPPARNYLVRNGEVIEREVISELGIYGVWISEDSVVHVNEAAGHLLRTKVADSNEGGVAAGFAVLDSPFLV
ncbi:glutathione synthase [Obelidium mucronatum]|nr:glutathione synthase [Obelidium mucronatum]